MTGDGPEFRGSTKGSEIGNLHKLSITTIAIKYSRRKDSPRHVRRSRPSNGARKTRLTRFGGNTLLRISSPYLRSIITRHWHRMNNWIARIQRIVVSTGDSCRGCGNASNRGSYLSSTICWRYGRSIDGRSLNRSLCRR